MARALSNKQLSELEPIIVAELIKARGKDAVKQVANKLKIDQDLVRHIYNTRKIGQKRQDLERSTIIINPSSINTPTDPSIIVDVGSLLPSEELIGKVSNISNNKKSEDTIVQKKEGEYFINDDLKLQVAMDYETGEYTYSSLAAKYGISSSSAYRIVKEIGGENVKGKKKKSTGRRSSSSSTRSINNHQRRKSISELEREYVKKVDTEETVGENIENTSNTENVENTNVIISEAAKTALSTSFQLEEVKEMATKVGLCADRHEMNVSQFIFGTLTEKEMFNYPLLYNKAMAFIADNCPGKILHLYCTGMQCALASVIKACHDSKCTLSLFHYNASTSTYLRQDMWKYNDTFIDELTAAYADIMRKGTVYTFGHNIKAEEFYTISINQVRENSDGFIKQAYVICDSLETAFRLYADYVKDITSDTTVRKAVFVTKCRVEKGKFIWDTNLSKSFNYK